jgi:DNA-binding NtrC family response regulator
MANILVVDDEHGIRELLSEILGDEGHTVQVAENAQQARLARAAAAPDLVLLDIWMPDTDGVTLLKEWSVAGLLTMPVIMMSGHATIDTAVEATRIGARTFLEKPITLQKLLKAVEQALAAERVHAMAAAHAAHLASVAAARAQLPHAIGAGAPVGATAQQQDTLDIPVAHPDVVQFNLDQPLREARDAFERAYFEHHLAREQGSMTRVADKTGLERTHLYRKLKQLGVELNKPKKSG